MEESTSKDFAEPVIPPGSQGLTNGTQTGFCVLCSPTPHPSPRDGERPRQEREAKELPLSQLGDLGE